MGWKSFGQGLAQNLLSTIIVLGGGALLAILQATHSHWTGPVLYGFLGASAVAVLMYALTGRPILSRKQPETTIANVETNIRVWLDYFGLAVKKENDPNFHFALVVTCRSAIPIMIGRPKTHEHSLIMGSNLAVSKEHQDVLASLSKEKTGRILEEITLELARTGVSYNFDIQPDGTLNKMTIQHGIPITASLSEEKFITQLDRIESAIQVAREATRLAIDSAKSQHPKR
jgi:hypothetical protein